jgi:hypothetical protein
MAQDLSSTTLGKDAVLCRSTGSSFASPTWVAIPNVQDLTMTDSRAEANVTGKGEDIGTIDTAYRDIEITFKIVFVKGDAGFSALAGAFHGNTPIQLLTLDGKLATVGATGINADWKITKFDKVEPLDGVVYREVAMKPAKTVNAPAAYTVAS